MGGTADSGSKPREIIREGIQKLGIPPEDSVYLDRIPVTGGEKLAELCGKYLEELSLFNKAFGLVSTGTETERGKSEVAVRHILDSLAPWKTIAEKICGNFPGRDFSTDRLRIADAGSGAGLPGIPLAFLFPGADFVLIERMSKRCSFLQNCRALLGTGNMSVLNSGIETAGQTEADTVVFRAFRPLEKKILRALLQLLKRSDSETAGKSFLAAYKGKESAIEEETKKMRAEGFAGKIDVKKISVPFLPGEERHIVFISE